MSLVAQSTAPSVIEEQPTRIIGFETANLHPTGTLELSIGARENSPGGRAGTGSQIYNGGDSYAFTDHFVLRLDIQNLADPAIGPVAGFATIPQVETNEVALWVKNQLYQNVRLSTAALRRLENFIELQSAFWA